MSNNGAEAPDLARLNGALVINMGTVTPDTLHNYLLALRAYNAAGRPVVFDPVGAGATAHRRQAVRTLLAGGYFDVIKGNENEISAVWAATATTSDDAPAQQQRGVDSGASSTTLEDRAQLVRALARREKNVVLMTGATDVLSDGATTLAISNGHAFLGAITGSGCTLGTAVAAYLAAAPGEKLVAALAAVLVFEIAAERAAGVEGVRGPGSFVPAFLDELWRVRGEAGVGEWGWLGGARVEVVGLEEED